MTIKPYLLSVGLVYSLLLVSVVSLSIGVVYITRLLKDDLSRFLGLSIQRNSFVTLKMPTSYFGTLISSDASWQAVCQSHLKEGCSLDPQLKSWSCGLPMLEPHPGSPATSKQTFERSDSQRLDLPRRVPTLLLWWYRKAHSL